MPYSCIVVGTDGSETAAVAVDHAGALANAAQCRLVIVTAFHDDATEPDDSVPVEVRWQVNDRNDADRLARKAREAVASTGVSDTVVQALRGDPTAMLLETAETFSADLIVVGSVGLASASRFVLGSVASSVSHHAPCDVLVVHTD
jgi:nucleotide-binding universal stress UspA family protein